MLREYLVSEAMAALGVPTTRSLAAVTTGEPVYRETALPGAVLARVAASHIRVGTFQYFAARGDAEAVRLLADYAIARHYPEAAEAECPHRALLDGVVARQAELVARWLLVGFVHGVMNTDNTSIAGETIDYGPCAFLDAYDPAAVFSSIDHFGRYAYGNQPRIAQWNLARLAEVPAAAARRRRGGGAGFGARVARRLRSALRGGLARRSAAQDRIVFGTRGRRGAGAGPAGGAWRRTAPTSRWPSAACATRRRGRKATRACAPSSRIRRPTTPGPARWRERLAEEPGAPSARAAAMRAVNPAVIPRNHLVEAVLSAAVEREDFGPFEGLLEALSRPYEDRPGLERYAMPPKPEERVLQTFCGT